MDQDIVLTLVAFGVLAFAIIGLKIFVHTKAQKLEEARKNESASSSTEQD